MKMRLKCLGYVLNSFSDEENISEILTEIILCTKESNAKTRNEAFELLVSLGRQHHQKGSESLKAFFTMNLAGLAATTPHMLSCTLTTLARLLYEFHGMSNLFVIHVVH
jgi:ribosomal RNA-processing protein 12